MSNQWLKDEVINGLQWLVPLNLAFAPERSPESIQLVAAAWLKVLLNEGKHWTKEQDSQRIRTGFERLATRCEQWPSPATLLKNMPKRDEAMAVEWNMPKQERKANIERLNNLVRDTKQNMTPAARQLEIEKFNERVKNPVGANHD